MNKPTLKLILEAALMTSAQPLSLDKMMSIFIDEAQPSRAEILEALNQLAQDYETRAIELKHLASGYSIQTRETFSPWIVRLLAEKPVKYSKALLETLAIIAYRQPVTRAEIEDIRGVSVSPSILKTLLEREWVRIAGHRDGPGKPAVYTTTKYFLDYFNLNNLQELPPLMTNCDVL